MYNDLLFWAFWATVTLLVTGFFQLYGVLETTEYSVPDSTTRWGRVTPFVVPVGRLLWEAGAVILKTGIFSLLQVILLVKHPGEDYGTLLVFWMTSLVAYAILGVYDSVLWWLEYRKYRRDRDRYLVILYRRFPVVRYVAWVAHMSSLLTMLVFGFFF